MQNNFKQWGVVNMRKWGIQLVVTHIYFPFSRTQHINGLIIITSYHHRLPTTSFCVICVDIGVAQGLCRREETDQGLNPEISA